MDTIIAIKFNWIQAYKDLSVVVPKLSNKMFLSSVFDCQHKYPPTETAFLQMWKEKKEERLPVLWNNWQFPTDAPH